MGLFNDNELQSMKPILYTQAEQYDTAISQYIYIRRAIYWVAFVVAAIALLGVIGETNFIWERLGISSEDYLWVGYFMVFNAAAINFWTADKKS